ncbi:MAG: aminofutalosine synthase MqnE [Alistipes sp.]|nr:aminofutalosine synthase MqnE [Alistipes sp.]
MRNINEIADAVRRNERITTDDAITLWHDAPLWLLGELATARKRKASGENVYYNRNVHLEPTNICLFNCEFCSFRRREGDKDAWYLSLDEIEARAAELKGADITEVHIVGGVHPKHDLDTYCAMIHRVKRQLPNVTVKAYTAVEIFYMIRREGISVVEGLRRLKKAGMECIPGGGAEIFDAELRAQICPEKCSAEEWLAVHRAAHNMGIATNCTMLYGHIETIAQRVDHLDRLRKLQDEAPGFDAFIPLKYHSRGNRLSEAGECSTEEDMRTIAISRIFLDNIPHIKAYWVSYGKATTEMALAFGADDIDGTIGDTTKIYSMAGGIDRPTMSVAELEAMVTDAGFRPIERDSHYNHITRHKVAEESIKESIVVGVDESIAPAENVEVEESGNVEITTNNDMSNPMIEQPQPVRKEPAKRSHKPKSRPKKSNKSTMAGSMRGTMEAIKRFYGRFPIISHIILIGIFGLLLLGTLYFGLNIGTRHGNVIKVPNFLGMTIEDARHVARNKELNIIVRDSIFDVNLPGGTVVDQLPRTSEVRDVTVKPGRKVYVTINAYNRRMVDVPYVAKQTLRQALNQLERSGLSINKLVYEADMTSTDYVLSESIEGYDVRPSSSIKAAVGTGVTLTVSYRRDEQYTIVPRLVGLTLQQAQSSLWDNGINVGKVIYDESVEDLISRRTTKVYKQSQALGTSIRRGNEVTLYLTCDMELVDSLAKAADKEAKRYEEQRRKELEKQRQAEKEGTAKSDSAE